jgi:prefoldin subunit 5
MTYKDIIDEKTAEWRNGLKKLENLAAKSTAETRAILDAKIEQLNSAIDSATAQLRHLDEHETVGNTVETKDKILKIFSSIDKDFIGHEEKIPYML